MADFNSIGVSGRLGADPDMRYNESGMAILSFNLANGIYKKGAEKNTHTTWYRCTLFGQRAEKLNEFLSKGSRVIVRGTHSIRAYTDKDGNERQANEITVDELTLIGSRNDTQQTDADEAPAQPQRTMRQAPPARNSLPESSAARVVRNKPVPIEADGSSEDLPF